MGQSSFNENILKNIEVPLPINDSENIDYSFIRNFIKAQQKESIKDVVEWKNKIIESAKNCC